MVILVNVPARIRSRERTLLSGPNRILSSSISFYLLRCRADQVEPSVRCKITALKGFLYTDGPFRAVSRTVQIFNNMGRQKSRQNFTFL